MANIRGWLTDLVLPLRLQALGVDAKDVADRLFDVRQPDHAAGRAKDIGQPDLRQLAASRDGPGPRCRPASGSGRRSTAARRPCSWAATSCNTSSGKPRPWRGASCCRIRHRVASSGGSMPHTRPPDSRPTNSAPNPFNSVGERSARKHQLPPVPQQGVHRVLQLDQRGPLAAEEMQIVDQQQLDIAVLAAEVGQAAALQRFEELTGELLGRQRHHPPQAQPLPHRSRQPLQQMRLARAGRAMHEQRRHPAKPLQDLLHAGKRQPIARAHHEFIERRPRCPRPLGPARSARRLHHGPHTANRSPVAAGPVAASLVAASLVAVPSLVAASLVAASLVGAGVIGLDPVARMASSPQTLPAWPRSCGASSTLAGSTSSSTSTGSGKTSAQTARRSWSSRVPDAVQRESVRHADLQPAVLQPELDRLAKPQVEPFLADSLGQGDPQRQHDFLIAVSHVQPLPMRLPLSSLRAPDLVPADRLGSTGVPNDEGSANPS